MGIHQVASDSVRLLMMFERVGRVHACTSECNVYECACMHVCVCVCVYECVN